MKYLNQSNIVKLAEYAIENGMTEDPVFKLWVKGLLKKWDHVVAMVNSKYSWTINKFGISITKSV